MPRAAVATCNGLMHALHLSRVGGQRKQPSCPAKYVKRTIQTAEKEKNPATSAPLFHTCQIVVVLKRRYVFARAARACQLRTGLSRVRFAAHSVRRHTFFSTSERKREREREEGREGGREEGRERPDQRVGDHNWGQSRRRHARLRVLDDTKKKIGA